MAKKKIQAVGAKPVSTSDLPIQKNNRFLKNPYLPFFIIGLFTFAIYSNSLWNKYAIDDTMVITDNTFTKRGIAGIPDIFKKDAFVGFFGGSD